MIESLEQLQDKAHKLLLQEPEDERPALLRYAERELDKAGLTRTCRATRH